MSFAVLILAAGQGTRLKSKLPKVLHLVAGKPMIEYSIDNARSLGVDKPAMVVGYRSDLVRQAIGDRVEYVEQADQRGTGHAVMQAQTALQGRADTVMVLYGDMPLLRAETLQALATRHAETRGCVTMLTVIAADPMGFGRVVRNAEGHVMRIVEESEATPAELAIKELNCGIYCFQADWLWEHLRRLKPAPRKGELFLTDLIEMAAQEGSPPAAQILRDVTEVLGINTRVHLAQAEAIARQRIRERVMLGGATLVDPASTLIDAQVQIAPDTVIHPGTYLQGRTNIGSDCRIGPNAHIRDSVVGDGCEILGSLLEGATLEAGVKIGPYCHLRPGTYLAAGVHLGDHAELKNARLGPETKMGHFAYIGDAQVGARVNIGAGTITCNYDGERKLRTVIGDDVFLGSDTLLVAPVTIGAGARTGAGAVVTHDVPPNTLVVGVPARERRKLT